VQRGRRSGYNNYSLQDQLLLCQLTESILPLGRNMWDQLAVKFNGSRTRNSPERDLESLRRKFKSLYAKPKPTGQEEVPVSLRPVVWAQKIQQNIEEACGVQTSHDGPDDGGNDEVLQTVVDSVRGGAEDTGQSRPAAADGASDRGRATEIGGGRGVTTPYRGSGFSTGSARRSRNSKLVSESFQLPGQLCLLHTISPSALKHNVPVTYTACNHPL
jgi:hypothetical protein